MGVSRGWGWRGRGRAAAVRVEIPVLIGRFVFAPRVRVGGDGRGLCPIFLTGQSRSPLPVPLSGRSRDARSYVRSRK